MWRYAWRTSNSPNNRFGKCSLVLAGCLLVGVAVAFLYLMYGTAVVAGTCGAIRKVNEGNYDFLTDSKVNATAEVQLVLKTCTDKAIRTPLAHAMLGNNAAQILHYKSFSQLIGGLQDYDNYINEVPSNYENVAFENQVKEWESIKALETHDYSNVQSSLDNLNTLIDCSTDTFKMTTAACGATADCKSIADTTTYTTPSCVSDSAAVQTQFTNLKAYETSTTTNMNSFIAAAGNIGDTTTLMGSLKQNQKNIIDYQT